VSGNPASRLPFVAYLHHRKEMIGNFEFPRARCYSHGMSVDLDTLQAAYFKVAALVVEDPAYLPIFERIEREIELLKKQDDVIERARAVAARYRAIA
jgi:hypothetical protein